MGHAAADALLAEVIKAPPRDGRPRSPRSKPFTMSSSPLTRRSRRPTPTTGRSVGPATP